MLMNNIDIGHFVCQEDVKPNFLS